MAKKTTREAKGTEKSAAGHGKCEAGGRLVSTSGWRGPPSCHCAKLEHGPGGLPL